MPDLTLTCQDCHNEFIWTEDDQQFYHSKGLESPKFCLICRAKHRAEKQDPGRFAKRNR
jgi:general stress protein 26